MIINDNNIPKIIRTLTDSEFVFYLTGSRFFEGKTEEHVDWDYFAEYSQDLEEWLKEIGFRTMHETEYRDGWVKKVYTYEYGQTKVDIQLINDTESKSIVQRILKHNPLFFECNKERRKDLWNLGFACYKNGQMCQESEQ